MEFTGCVLGDGDVYLIQTLSRSQLKITISRILLIFTILIIFYNLYLITKRSNDNPIRRLFISGIVLLLLMPNVTYPNSSENRQYEFIDLSQTDTILVTHKSRFLSKHHVIKIPHLFTEEFIIDSKDLNYEDIIKLQTMDGIEYNIMIKKELE